MVKIAGLIKAAEDNQVIYNTEDAFCHGQPFTHDVTILLQHNVAFSCLVALTNRTEETPL